MKLEDILYKKVLVNLFSKTMMITLYHIFLESPVNLNPNGMCKNSICNDPKMILGSYVRRPKQYNL